MLDFLFLVPTSPDLTEGSLRKDLQKLCFEQVIKLESSFVVWLLGEAEIEHPHFKTIACKGTTKEEKLKEAGDQLAKFPQLAKYLVRLDDDDLINPKVFDELANRNFDIAYDRKHFFYDLATDLASAQKRDWIPNTAIMDFQKATTKVDDPRPLSENTERSALSAAKGSPSADTDQPALSAAEGSRSADTERLALSAAEGSRSADTERSALSAAEGSRSADTERLALNAAEGSRSADTERSRSVENYLFACDHSRAWHPFFQGTQIVLPKEPVYARILNPESITATASGEFSENNYFRYLQGFGAWKAALPESLKPLKPDLMKIRQKHFGAPLNFKPKRGFFSRLK